MPKLTLSPDRYFDPEPVHKSIAMTLYDSVASLPLVCPHGHVDPGLFADPDYVFESPSALLIIPDHYIYRMLYSQGIALDQLGISRRDGAAQEHDHRKIWQVFAENIHLFSGTPTGMWLRHELHDVFEVREQLTGQNAQQIYDHIAEKLAQPEFKPRALFKRFNIEVLATTDAATDPLQHHRKIRDSGWEGRVIPTLRPDAIVTINTENWRRHIEALSDAAGIHVHNYKTLVQALERRRETFKAMGATATDHGTFSAHTETLSPAQVDDLMHVAFRGEATNEDARRFTGHMLIELARMSAEDGLVMQLHVGSYRNHNRSIYEQFGRDRGCDIPVIGEFTHGLKALLDVFGNHPRFRMIVFTLDESTYSRELAPLAGHYPTLKLGAPWWFHDSLNGMRRYFDQVMETAGLYNTAGFNDDTRAFPSIPARHDLWRRAAANWAAGLVIRGIVDMDEGMTMVRALSYDLAKEAYRL